MSKPDNPDVEQTRRLIAEAVRAMDVSETDAWTDLAVISYNTIVDTIEVFEDEIVCDGARFRGPIVWHVTLTYGQGDDEFTSSDSFPGTFEGEMRNNAAVVEKMTADVSSFYE
ncbi:hypothetical protein [Dongia sp.]|uniref:pPIWI-associating nuclease domain-containing protein n=1 Tax=Dongia sp. TaxID=1977262 RepID=UPI00375276F5